MESTAPAYRLTKKQDGQALLELSGEWTLQQDPPEFSGLASELEDTAPGTLACAAPELGHWDSALPAFLMQCHQFSQQFDLCFLFHPVMSPDLYLPTGKGLADSTYRRVRCQVRA